MADEVQREGEFVPQAEAGPDGGKALLDELTKDYNRLRAQKARKTGGIEGRVLLNLGFVSGEQHISHKEMGIYTDPQEDGRLYLVFNLIGPRLNKLLGRLSAIDPIFRAQPDKDDAQAKSEAAVVDKVIMATDQIVNQPSRTWEILWWMAVGGTAFEYVPWIPNSTIAALPKKTEEGELLFRNKLTGEEMPGSAIQQLALTQPNLNPAMFEVVEEAQRAGEVGSEILGPLNVFIDQSVKDLDSLAPDQRVYVAKIRTMGWVEENFGVKAEGLKGDKDFQIVTTQFHQLQSSTGGVFLKDLIPLVQGTNDSSGPGMVTVVESFAPASEKNPAGRFTVFVPGKMVLHDAENPYGEIPLVDFHWSPVTTTFWTQDYVTNLIAPQRFINKRMSQLGEQANSTLYSMLLLGADVSPADIPIDKPGMVPKGLTEGGMPNVQRLPPPQLPNWFMNSLELTIQLFNDVAGGADLLQESQFPGQLRGPLAVPMLQEILDTGWGPLYNHIGERMARVKQMRLNRVKQFYEESRTLHFTNRDQKDETVQFHAEQILGKGTNYNISIERASLIPELRSLREERIKSRLNSPLAIMYIDERTGAIDKSKVAADLKYGDQGRESREATFRHLGAQIVDRLWNAQPVPPVLPFYDHGVMMDELEHAMSTMEWLEAPPEIQQAFTQRWEEHRQFAIMEAQAQQQAMLQQQTQSAVAQATQQAAAMAAAETVDATRGQLREQKKQPTRDIVAEAEAQTQGGR